MPVYINEEEPVSEDSSKSSHLNSWSLDSSTSSWKATFLAQKENEFFCEVPDSYIKENFNLYGLSYMVPFYEEALNTLLGLWVNKADYTQEQHVMIHDAVIKLYGLIHKRFILSIAGLHVMGEKFMRSHFGRCPRVFCAGQNVLPVGQSDVIRESTVKLYCPKCGDIYFPRSSCHRWIDGAYWGTTFPHLLLMYFRRGGRVPVPPMPLPNSHQKYVPKIFGFRIRYIPENSEQNIKSKEEQEQEK